jgi:hypothetical protein
LSGSGEGPGRVTSRPTLQQPLPPVACTHPVPCSLATLPLVLGAARMPSAARFAGALTRGCRDSPRPRAPLPSRASAQRLGGLTGCQQTPSGGGVPQRRILLPSPCMMVAMIRSAPRWQNGQVAISRAHTRLSNCAPLQRAAVLASCASTLCWAQCRDHRRAQCAM